MELKLANNLYEILNKIDETNDLLRGLISEQQAIRRHIAQLKHLHKTNTYYTIPDTYSYDYRDRTYRNLIDEMDKINF